MALEKGKKTNVPPTCTEREPSFSKGAAALFLIFSIEEATSSGICSTPIARPSGPTINAKHAVKYPVPVKENKYVNWTQVYSKSGAGQGNDIWSWKCKFQMRKGIKLYLLRVAVAQPPKKIKLQEKVCWFVCLFASILRPVWKPNSWKHHVLKNEDYNH